MSRNPRHPIDPTTALPVPGPAAGTTPRRKKDRTHWLYIGVVIGVLAGIGVGFLDKELAVSLKPIGTAFVNLIKMMIGPVIFCTIVLGIGSIRKAAQVGRVGGLALTYFIVMSTVALGIGLVVGNILHPGEGLQLTEQLRASGAAEAVKATETAQSSADFVLGIIPTSLFSSLTSGIVLQALLVAMLTGFALQMMGRSGEPILRGIGHLQKLVFKILSMIMWLAPIGAFGAMAAVVGAMGGAALAGLATIMIGFYITCILFVLVVLGGLLYAVTRINILSLLKYLGREFLLIFSTSSSESALPRLIAKMEHLGVSRPVVGITVPTGYSFNLDGTAIYLTMSSLFIASAMGSSQPVSEQISLLLFMMIASKGAAGVTGAGLATLAGGLQAHRPDLVDGVGLIVGIDRFMSEARALTNFAGNAVATVLIGTWTREFDKVKATEVLAGRDPFDESSLDELGEEPGSSAAPASAGQVGPLTEGPAPRRAGDLVNESGAPVLVKAAP